MKDLVTKKKIVEFDIAYDLHHFSAKVISLGEQRFVHLNYYLYYWWI